MPRSRSTCRARGGVPLNPVLLRRSHAHPASDLPANWPGPCALKVAWKACMRMQESLTSCSCLCRPQGAAGLQHPAVQAMHGERTAADHGGARQPHHCGAGRQPQGEPVSEQPGRDLQRDPRGEAPYLCMQFICNSRRMGSAGELWCGQAKASAQHANTSVMC